MVAPGSDTDRFEPNRFDVFLISLDPVRGSEIKKTRPCLVLSPDEMNRHIRTVIVAPMTTRARAYPSRIPCTFQGKQGQIVLDQIRTVDKTRLTRRLGAISAGIRSAILDTLQEMFAE